MNFLRRAVELQPGDTVVISARPVPGNEVSVMDTVNRVLGYGTGPRAALVFGVACYILGAVLLKPVVEKRREDSPAPVEAAS